MRSRTDSLSSLRWSAARTGAPTVVLVLMKIPLASPFTSNRDAGRAALAALRRNNPGEGLEKPDDEPAPMRMVDPLTKRCPRLRATRIGSAEAFRRRHRRAQN